MLEGPITYNGLTIPATGVTRIPGGGPGSGYRAVHLDISPIGVAQYLDKAALRDGVNVGDIFEAQRMVTVSCDVYGDSDGDLWDQVQAFLAAFSPVNAYHADTANFGFLPLTFRQPSNLAAWSSTGYIPLQVYARPNAPATFTEDLGVNVGGKSGNGHVMRVSSQLLCRDPRKYLQTQQVVSFSSSGLNTSLTNRGDRNTFGTLELNMLGAGSSTFTCNLTSVGPLVLNLSGITAGDTVYVDYEHRTIKLNALNKMSLLVSGAFGMIESGASLVITNATNCGSCSFTYSEAWN